MLVVKKETMHIRLSDKDKQIAKPSLNRYLDDFWNNIKYKDNVKFNTLFFKTRLKYA